MLHRNCIAAIVAQAAGGGGHAQHVDERLLLVVMKHFLLAGGWHQRRDQARGLCHPSHREGVTVPGQGWQVPSGQRHQGRSERRGAHGDLLGSTTSALFTISKVLSGA